MSVRAATAPKTLPTPRRLRTGVVVGVGAVVVITMLRSAVADGSGGGDAESGAWGGVGAGADLGRRGDLGVEDLLLDVLLRDHLRDEEHGRGAEHGRDLTAAGRLDRLALHQVDGNLRRGTRDDLTGLGDRVVLVAGDHQFQPGDGSGVAGDRRDRR